MDANLIKQLADAGVSFNVDTVEAEEESRTSEYNGAIVVVDAAGEERRIGTVSSAHEEWQNSSKLGRLIETRVAEGKLKVGDYLDLNVRIKVAKTGEGQEVDFGF